MTSTAIEHDAHSSTPPSPVSDFRNGEKQDVERVEAVPPAQNPNELTTLDGGVVTMTWKTWVVIFVRILTRFSTPILCLPTPPTSRLSQTCN